MERKDFVQAWHNFTSSPVLPLVKAQEFINTCNSRIDLASQFNNDRAPFHLEPVQNKIKLVFYRDEVFELLSRGN